MGVNRSAFMHGVAFLAGRRVEALHPVLKTTGRKHDDGAEAPEF
jgi:hypothetical protein